jgi:hypothetical protein
MLIALIREISPAFDRCELTHLAHEPIDLMLARAQPARPGAPSRRRETSGVADAFADIGACTPSSRRARWMAGTSSWSDTMSCRSNCARFWHQIRSEFDCRIHFFYEG